MSKSIFLILTNTLLSVFAFSQSLTSKEAAAIQTTLHDHFYKNITESEQFAKRKENAPAEAFLCMLNFDNIGRISGVRFIGETKYIDSAYCIFSKMTLNDFKALKIEKCKGKTLIIPLLLVPRNIETISLYEASGLISFLKPKESGDLIIIRGLDFAWPNYVKDATPGKITKVEQVTKKNN